MSFIVPISQTLLYFSLSVLIGTFILLLVRDRNRPAISFSKRLLFVSSILLPVYAFVPVLEIILYIAPRLGAVEAFKIVLTTYTVGTAWNFTFLSSLLLVLLIFFSYSTSKKSFAFLGTLLTLVIMTTIAWSSHAGALNPFVGFISDFVHLVAVSIWVGILLVVAWFSNNHQNWLSFLRWFSPVAFSCLIATSVSGVVMMNVLMDGYVDSWVTSYGQGLLVKHLFLLPLLFYAVVNGVLVRNKLRKDSTFNPIRWVRLESIILFAIFTITSIFSQQSPQVHELTAETISPLFQLFHGTIYDESNTIGFAVNAYTISFFVMSCLLLSVMALTYVKKASVITSFLFSCLFVISVYVMVMVSLIIH